MIHGFFKLKSPNSLKNQQPTRITFEKELSLLRQVFNHYSEYLCEGVSSYSPIKKRHFKDCVVNLTKYKEKKVRDKKKFLSGSEIERFINTMKTTYQKQIFGYTIYLLALFQLRTGTRIGEAAAVHWEDICFDSSKVHISKSVLLASFKGSKNLYIGNNKERAITIDSYSSRLAYGT